MDKPTPHEWLSQNPGKSLQDYFLRYPPAAQSPAAEPIVGLPQPKDKERDSFIPVLIGLAIIVIIILIYPIVWTLWFIPLLFIGSGGIGYQLVQYFEKKTQVGGKPVRARQADKTSLATIGIMLLPIFVVGVGAKYVAWNSWQRQEIIVCNAYPHPIEITWNGKPQLLPSQHILVEKIYDHRIELTDPKDTTAVRNFELAHGGNFFIYGLNFEILLTELRYGRGRSSTFFIPKSKRLKKGHHLVRGDLTFYPQDEVPRVLPETSVRGSAHYGVGMRKSLFHPDSRKLSDEELLEEAMKHALESVNELE